MSAIAPAFPGTPIVSAPDEIRVMVVDDAAIVRSLLSRWVEEAPGLKLVAALRNGREAIERLDHARPDVVVLDVEMPELDGISTLPRLLERRRDAQAGIVVFDPRIFRFKRDQVACLLQHRFRSRDQFPSLLGACGAITDHLNRHLGP